MKPQFSLFQKIMTTIFIVLQAAVMISDGIRLATDDGSGSGTYYYAVNLVLCAGLLAVFLMLIFNPKLCVSTEETDTPEQLHALISASRTYMCFIAVDISLIFAFVMFLSQYVSHPALIIIIGGVALFIAGAVKYIYDSQKLVGIETDEVTEEQQPQEQTEQESVQETETPAETEVEEQSPAEADTAEINEEQPQEQTGQTTEQETAQETEAPAETEEEEQSPAEEDEAAEVTEEQTAEDEATEEEADEEEAPSEV